MEAQESEWDYSGNEIIQGREGKKEMRRKEKYLRGNKEKVESITDREWSEKRLRSAIPKKWREENHKEIRKQQCQAK